MMSMVVVSEMLSRTIADRLLVFSLAVGFLRLTPTVESFACPMSFCTCRYKGGKEAAECAGKRLVTLPTGLSGDTQILDVSRNNFEELPKDMFFKAALTNLQKVYLAECKIRKIDDSALSHLANLVELDLESNLLIAVPSETFVDCPGLRRLNLNRNHIRRVESNAFARLPSLASLELSDCFLEYVGPRAFVGLDHLRQLKLDGNRLTVLPPDVGFPLRSLHSLDLFDNPWRCDCRLRVLRHWLFVDRLPVIAPPLCVEPNRLRDWPIVDVRPEDFACEPSVVHTSNRALEAYNGASVVVLECRVQADPPPLVRWSRHDRILSNRTVQQKHYVITEMGTVHKTAFLSISDVSWDDAGQYLCAAENVAGRVIVNLTLDVVERLGANVAGNLSDGHVALIGLVLVFVVTLVTAVFLFLFLSRRRLRRSNDETCKHVPLEKKQLVDQHVKFSVHEEKLEMTTTPTTRIDTSKPFANSNYESVRRQMQDTIRLEDGLHRSGTPNNNNRPDIVKSVQSKQANVEDSCRSLFGSLFSTPSIFKSQSPQAVDCLHGDATAPILNGAVLPNADGTTSSSSSSSVPERLRRSVSRDRFGLGYSTLHDDTSASPVRRVQSRDEEEEEVVAGDLHSRTTGGPNDAASKDGGLTDSCDVANKSRTITRDSLVSSNGAANHRIPFNRAVIQQQHGAAHVAASSGRRLASALVGNAPGLLKHANLHGRNYVAVLPPLPAHHFAQIRDSPDEGYEDEVNEEELDT